MIWEKMKIVNWKVKLTENGEIEIKHCNMYLSYFLHWSSDHEMTNRNEKHILLRGLQDIQRKETKKRDNH